VQAEEQQSDSDLPVIRVGTAKSTHPITVVVEVDDQTLTMEVDTGAAVSIISEAMWRRVFPGASLKAFHHPSEDLHG